MENQTSGADVQSAAYDLADKFLRVAIDFHQDHPDVLSPQQDQYKNFPDGYSLIFNIRMKDFITTDPNKKFAHYGFIARENNTPNYVIAIRGTQTKAELAIDAEKALIPWGVLQNKVKVEEGFANLYASLQLLRPGSEATNDKIQNMGRLNKITMIGHSLGSSLVTLYGTQVATETKNEVTIYTLASPSVGDQAFVDHYTKVIKESHRVFNTQDDVPNALQKQNPNYKHVPEPYALTPDGHINQDKSLGCNHSFYTYLYLLSGTPDVGDSPAATDWKNKCFVK